MTFFWCQGIFFSNFDLKNGCKNEFEDKNEKSQDEEWLKNIFHFFYYKIGPCITENVRWFWLGVYKSYFQKCFGLEIAIDMKIMQNTSLVYFERERIKFGKFRPQIRHLKIRMFAEIIILIALKLWVHIESSFSIFLIFLSKTFRFWI